MTSNRVFFICILLSISLALADLVPASPPVSTDTACNVTLYPTFCKTLLPRNGGDDIHGYGRFSVSRSLSSARKFAELVDKYLAKSSTLSKATILALEDCKLLAGLNMDFLLSTSKTLNSSKTLLSYETEDLQCLLSAIVTNQETCFEGLEAASSAWSVKNGLYSPLSNETKLYSVSLALFNRGWFSNRKKGRGRDRKKTKGRKLLFTDTKPGHLPLIMSSRNREIFESACRRNLLQTNSDNVVVRDIVVVNPDGSGNFTNINAAVAAAPNNTVIDDGYFLIYISAGVYEEYISIDKKKKNIMMIGDGINQTIITGSNNVADGSTTFNSATLAVVGQGFVAVNITVRNTAGAAKHQAVAVRNGADLSTFYSCSFEAYQDTLYTHSLRQFYRDCDIYGTVDFIFGNAAVVLQNCNIYARLPMSGQYNAVTAQGRTDPNQNTGISIHNCKILAAADLASSSGTTKSYLGRPWKEYSRTVIMQSTIGSLIHPTGWREWSGDFALSTLYYAEYNNVGAGSNTSGRVTWPGYHASISTVDAGNFTVDNFILGADWLPATGVEYTPGLL